MIVKVIHYDGFVNFLHIPETDEERDAMAELAIRIEKVKAANEMNEEIERIITNGNN